MCTLLALNFSGYVAGAGVSCMGYCNLRLDIPTRLYLDARNRDILGALQLVAKFLEAWFVIIAGSLAFDLSLHLATTRDGLPLRHLFAHVRLADPSAILSWSAWTSVRPRTGKSAHGAFTLYAFVGFTSIILCILVNLMGPATAVLILPTLGTREFSGTHDVRFFDQVRSGGAPRLAGCSQSDLDAGKYSCADPGPIDSITARNRNGDSMAPLWQQEFFYFQPNTSGSPPGTSWIPNRRLLLALGDDFLAWSFAINHPTFQEYQSELNKTATGLGRKGAESVSEGQYRLYRESLQTTFERNGPSLGSYSHCKRSITRVQVSEDRQVHCYSIPTRQTLPNGEVWTPVELRLGFVANQPSDDAGTRVTKCIRVGSGWGAAAPLHAQFHFGAPGADGGSSRYTADIYSADRAVYLTPEQSRCAQADSAQACDWQQLFSADVPTHLRNTSLNVLFTEYTAPNGTQPAVLCETLAHLSFPTYHVDDSSNIILQGIERDLATPPVPVHPGWVLAAWSVDSSGTIDSMSRQAGGALARALQNTATDDSQVLGHADVEYIQTNAMNQALSLVDYTTAPPAPDGSGPDPAHPIEQASQQVRVWQYGFGSRTSVLGAVVAMAGCAVVLLRAGVGLWVRARPLELTTLVAAALKQPEVETLRGLSDREVGQTRFVLEGDGTREGIVYVFPGGTVEERDV
jgi:hypothetical protein